MGAQVIRIYILWQTPGRSEGSGRPGNQLAPPPGHITIPPDNEAGLKAIKLECLLLKRGAGYHKPELGLALASRQDLCDRLIPLNCSLCVGSFYLFNLVAWKPHTPRPATIYIYIK